MAKSTAAAAPQTSHMAVCGLRSRRVPQGPAKDKDGICDSSCSIWPNLQRGVLPCRASAAPIDYQEGAGIPRIPVKA